MNPSLGHQAWLDVAVFEDLEAGRVLEAFLKDTGLEARTYDDKFFRYFLFLRPPRVTYRVQVRAGQFEGVTELLRAKVPEVLDRALHCPSCGSLRVNYPQMTRKFVLPTIMLHLGIIFHIIAHQCYCEHCQAVWNLPENNTVDHKPEPAKLLPF